MSITKEQVLAAANCSTPKEALKQLFPEYFEPEYFEFGEKVEVTRGWGNSPFIIGYNWPPSNLKNKCLIVSCRFFAEIVKQGERQLITFKKK